MHIIFVSAYLILQFRLPDLSNIKEQFCTVTVLVIIIEFLWRLISRSFIDTVPEELVPPSSEFYSFTLMME